jgi:hypothetical protein
VKPGLSLAPVILTLCRGRRRSPTMATLCAGFVPPVRGASPANPGAGRRAACRRGGANLRPAKHTVQQKKYPILARASVPRCVPPHGERPHGDGAFPNAAVGIDAERAGGSVEGFDRDERVVVTVLGSDVVCLCNNWQVEVTAQDAVCLHHSAGGPVCPVSKPVPIAVYVLAELRELRVLQPLGFPNSVNQLRSCADTLTLTSIYLHVPSFSSVEATSEGATLAGTRTPPQHEILQAFARPHTVMGTIVSISSVTVMAWQYGGVLQMLGVLTASIQARVVLPTPLVSLRSLNVTVGAVCAQPTVIALDAITPRYMFICGSLSIG